MFRTSTVLATLALLAISGCKTTSDSYGIPKSTLAKEQQQDTSLEPQYELEERSASRKTLSAIEYQRKAFDNDNNKFIPEIKDKDQVINVSANQLALADFIHLVFGENLKLNYVIDEQLQNKRQNITLSLPNGVTKERLYVITADLLSEKDIKIEHKNDVLFVIPKPRNAQEKFAIGAGREISDIPQTAGNIMQFIPLEYTDWGNLNKLLKQLTNAKFNFNDLQNSIMVTGTYKEVEQVIKVVTAFDRPSSRGKHIRLIELIYIKPDDFKEQLETLFQAEGLAMSRTSTSGGLVVTPMPRMRSVLIHTTSKRLLERVEYWSEQLDVPTSSDGKRYFTYFPKNIRAESLGESLSKLFGLEENSKDKELKGNTRQGRNNSGGGFISDEIAMSVDNTQNVLMFYTTPSKYHDVVKLIEQIDILPGQVLLEAAITEVTLEGNFSMGVDWSFNEGNYQIGTKGGLGEIGGALTYSLTGLNYSATMAFLQGQSKVNILSKPRILVKDGAAAQLNIGTEIPLLSQTSTDLDPGNDRVLQNVQYRTTGVSLSVTPTINAQGVVSIKINQQVSEAGENKLSGVDSPIILNRSFSTELLARDGQTVVLGGLISENNSDGSTQVPILGDIPILGNAFKSQSDRTNRVELVVMLTPRIIKSDQDINDLMEIMTSEFENFKVE